MQTEQIFINPPAPPLPNNFFKNSPKGERAEQVVFDCTSELSREIMDGSVQTGEEDDEMGGEGDLNTAEIGGVVDGAGGGGGGEGRSGKGGGGLRKADGTADNDNNPKRALAKPDFRLMKSLQMVCGELWEFCSTTGID